MRFAASPPSLEVALQPASASPAGSPWLFSRSTDLWVFVGPAVAAGVLVIAGGWMGLADADAPEWLWIGGVLLVDVAHVWSTLFRVYADPTEVWRRPALYLGAPLGALLAGLALHAIGGSALFWRVLAYLAVFHFVRQQYGWVMLLRHRMREPGGPRRWLDAATIYAATLYPLIYWHTHLPRHFSWFMPGDFLEGLPRGVERVAQAGYWSLTAAYCGLAAWDALRGRPTPWGKHLVMLTTWLCWFVGIVVFDSDYIFTATNVLIHGVPYLALTWRYASATYAGRPGLAGILVKLGWPFFYVSLVALAWLEEGAWDSLVWHDHPAAFGGWEIDLGRMGLAVAASLLAVPQAVHYLLDGFVWRKGRGNPELSTRLRL